MSNIGTRSNSSPARDTALVTPSRSVTRTRNNATTASSVSGASRSPSSFRRRQNELLDFRDGDSDVDTTYHGGALLKTRPDLLTEASERAAEKLQAAIEGSSMEEHFTKFNLKSRKQTMGRIHQRKGLGFKEQRRATRHSNTLWSCICLC